ncbi:MAG: hypothetical protein ACTSQK_02280 [Candidatus Heimdallarchaeota archaeon]
MKAVDRYSITYKEEVKHFNNHDEAIIYVLGLPPSTDKIKVKKYGSWQKVLIDIDGEINEIQRLVKVVGGWKSFAKKQ